MASIPRWLQLIAGIALIVAVSACTRTVDGAAAAPAGTDPAADVLLSADGFGIQLGKPFAQAQIEVYIEPQCPHCRSFLLKYGDEILQEIKARKLTVTYRPLTFLDRTPGGYSAQVSNALFLAARPHAGVSAAELQEFLHNLYASINPAGGYAWIAQIARDSHLPSALADQIGAGDTAVNTETMYSVNKARFKETMGSDPYTPGVYDLCAKKAVEITEGWLSKLIAQSACTAS